MPDYRITVRYGRDSTRYEVLDLQADDLRAALQDAAARLSGEVIATADLAEIRVQPGPGDRTYGPQ
jgi:hypothetical protein